MNQPNQPEQSLAGTNAQLPGEITGSEAAHTSAAPQRMQAQMAAQPGEGLAASSSGQPMTLPQEEVIAVRKNGDGDIIQLQLTSGQIVDYKTAQAMVKNNQIRNLNVFRGRDGEEHLRSNADGNPDNNLDSLPTF